MLSRNAVLWGSTNHIPAGAGSLEKRSLCTGSGVALCLQGELCTDSRHSSQEARCVLRKADTCAQLCLSSVLAEAMSPFDLIAKFRA